MELHGLGDRLANLRIIAQVALLLIVKMGFTWAAQSRKSPLQWVPIQACAHSESSRDPFRWLKQPWKAIRSEIPDILMVLQLEPSICDISE
jgi:hypothetical protein